MVLNTEKVVPADRSRNWARLLATVIASLFGFALLFWAAAFLYFEHSVRPAVLDSTQKSILELEKPFRVPQRLPEAPVELKFSSSAFQHPDPSFRPWVRWWWPGDAVDDAELETEIARFATTGFGGFEVQSFARGLNVRTPSPKLAAFEGFDTPSFYRHVQVALQSAARHNLQADLTIGSGYPTASSQISPQDNLLTMAYGYGEVSGPKALDWEVRPPSPSFWYKALSVAGKISKRKMIDFYSADAIPIATIAYRIVDRRFRSDLLSVGWQPNLDASSAIDLTAQVSPQGRVRWRCPPGRWVIITFYVMPSGTRPFPGPAIKNPGLILNFFDPVRVGAMNNYLFGPRTGLPSYFGQPLRAIFADSFELQAERFVVPDILQAFRSQRGYDLAPHLGALPVPGRDNWYLNVAGVRRHPAFVLNDEDERVRYDYDLTISELFIQRYIGTSRNWSLEHGLRQRVQPYGLNINIVKAAGLSDIPETEVLYAGGTEMFLKLVSSGAHLYNRPLISAEAFDHPGIGATMTLAALKAEADRLFLAGVNQIVFHGSPYRLKLGGAANSKWYPFNASRPTFTVSTDFDQTGELWDQLKPLNDYIARCQYLLRLGKPKTDVLIYYPFLGFPNDYASLSHHKEFGFNGLMPGLQPLAAHSPVPAMLAPLFISPDKEEVVWLDKVWPTLLELESKGITWEWITQAELGTATACNQRICIGQNSYSSLALIQIKSLAPLTANHLHQLAFEGGHIHFIGSTPSQQTSYRDFRRGDRIVQQQMDAIEAIHSESIEDAMRNVESDAKKYQTLVLSSGTTNIRRVDRVLGNSESLTFLLNQSSKDAEILLEFPSSFHRSICLDAVTGNIQRLARVHVKQSVVRLAANQSIFIVQGRNP